MLLTCSQAPGFIKSNAELIDVLASVTNMEPSTAILTRGTIVFGDSISGGKHYTSGGFEMSSGLVSGGRLGRDHMLIDVPNHHVRDRLMDYINTQLEEDQRERARLAVFADLSPAQIEEYSALVTQLVKKRQPRTTEELIALVAGDRPIRTDSERRRVIAQGMALEDVYLDVDLTPKLGFGKRTYDRLGPIICSVVDPNEQRLTLEERDLKDPEMDIDRDCDQIRAMIAMLAFKKEWTLDQFRLALGDGIERKDLTKFLCQDGPRKGNNRVFQLAWEFFKRRELLGLSLTDTPNDGKVLEESNTNTRKRVDAGENSRVTRSKRARNSN